MENREYTTKIIRNEYFANKLFKMGHKLVGFNSNKYDKKRTVFFFEIDKFLEDDLNYIIEESNRRKFTKERIENE